MVPVIVGTQEILTFHISDIDKQKRKFSSDISEMCKLLNADLDKIEKQKVEEMVSEEQHVLFHKRFQF
jgi:hypothetical protein